MTAKVGNIVRTAYFYTPFFATIYQHAMRYPKGKVSDLLAGDTTHGEALSPGPDIATNGLPDSIR